MNQVEFHVDDPVLRERMLAQGKSKPATPFLFFGPLVLAQLIYGSHLILSGQDVSLFFGAGLYAAGLLGWTLIEYVLHRFSFHPVRWLARTRVPFVGYFVRATSTVHLSHHEAPNRPDLVVAPIKFSGPLYLIYMGAFALVTGSIITTLFFSAGLLSGYMLYEFVHYSVHWFKPRTPIGRYWKKYHMTHHFADTHNYFGVTTPIWDFVFRTHPAPVTARASKNRSG